MLTVCSRVVVSRSRSGVILRLIWCTSFGASDGGPFAEDGGGGVGKAWPWLSRRRRRIRPCHPTNRRHTIPRAISPSCPLVGDRRRRAAIERRPSHAASGRDRSAFNILLTARRRLPVNASPQRIIRISACRRAEQAL